MPPFGNLFHVQSDLYGVVLKSFVDVIYHLYGILVLFLLNPYLQPSTDFFISGSFWDQRRVKWFPSYRLARQGSCSECWEQVIKCISFLSTSRTSELFIFLEFVLCFL